MLWVLHSPCPCHRCQVGAIALLDGNRHPRSFARMDPVLGCMKSKPQLALGRLSWTGAPLNGMRHCDAAAFFGG